MCFQVNVTHYWLNGFLDQFIVFGQLHGCVFVSSSSKPVSCAFSQQKLISTPKALDIWTSRTCFFPEGFDVFFSAMGMFSKDVDVQMVRNMEIWEPFLSCVAFFVKTLKIKKKTTQWRMLLLDDSWNKTCLPKLRVVIPWKKTRFPNIIFFSKAPAGSPPAFSNNGMHKAVKRKCERWFVCILTRRRNKIYNPKNSRACKQINPSNCEKHWGFWKFSLGVVSFKSFGVNLLQAFRFRGMNILCHFSRRRFRPSRVAAHT